MTKAVEIKTMKLYHHLERIERRLKHAAASKDVELVPEKTSGDDSIDPEVLGTLDSLHFYGDEPIQAVQKLLGQVRETRGVSDAAAQRVLDIGTGFGGTARLLAHRTGVQVDALELQPDLSDTGRELTRRCGLERQVTHLTGDFLVRPVTHERYDVIVGLLCFLHIGQWRELFTRCCQSLQPGGVLYVEDFFRRNDEADFNDEEKRILREDVYCVELCVQAELQALIQECGLEVVQFEDVTTKWLPYVTKRAENYEANLEKHIMLDGEATAKGLNHFYKSVADIFTRGNLGGYTLVARRPLP
ncbi:hypothetical protein Poli38472_010223 [Pythium oligandrum]|uniref:Methyltransferase domain-containing protein n=1 Tax=Pythium oligandrum TaxID=41045 RepID=A0A8K1FF58_PYTOL|nr:hypothetical protein Poli38472_010223 [Pythium oligandrum]|eukprot:TMW58664.1 hypothetical protein Poli38472_010223 [Pythium oligandrum]